jgi:hypothetical protein
VMVIVRLLLGENHRLRGWQAVLKTLSVVLPAFLVTVSGDG